MLWASQRLCHMLGVDGLMRGLVAFWIGLILVGLRPEQAFAWGPEGHEAVATIAERFIAPSTRAKVKELLAEGGDVDLGSVACWADDVILASRGEGPLSANAEAKEFNNRFPNNRRWHFINLPLGTLSFEEARRFTPPESIVHAISRCIQVLESPVANPREFTRVQALRLLVHFVGDVHQPLHCGTGYYSVDKPGTAELVTDPGEAFGKPNDRGGNLLFYGKTPTEQLHAFWDIVIVQALINTADSQALADSLSKNATGEQMTKTPGDYHHWAEAWIIDSVRVATLAYLAIVFEKTEIDANKNLLRIDIKLPANYLDANRVYAAQQLTRAGVRLAQLLDSINWPSVAKP